MNKLNTLGVSSAMALSSLFGNDGKDKHLKERVRKANRKKNKLAKAARKQNRR